jgi:hypothetical protein
MERNNRKLKRRERERAEIESGAEVLGSRMTERMHSTTTTKKKKKKKKQKPIMMMMMKKKKKCLDEIKERIR